MGKRSGIGSMLFVAVALMLLAAGCASPEEIARRKAEELFQTQQAAIVQTAESVRLTAEAAIKDRIPDIPSLPQPGQSEPSQDTLSFSRLPIEKSEWNNGFGAHTFARDNWEAYYTKLGGLHNGADFGAEAKTSVYAGLTGKLTGTSGDALYGGNVVVTVGDYVVTYGHTVRNPDLKDGQDITPDTVIGTIFDQGTNDHLHLSIKSGGYYLNPLPFFDAGLINDSDWGPYVENEGPYSMISFKPLPTSEANYWQDLNVDKLEIKRP